MSRIDKERGLEAARMLASYGLVSEKEASRYADMVRDGLSYYDLMIEELGKKTGVAYLAEEFAQHMILGHGKIDFKSVSVPEILLAEDSEQEPWHQGLYTQSSAKMKFQAEAAEPWHRSLREAGYKPLKSVEEWFRRHPQYKKVAHTILSAVYGTLE